MKKGKDMDNLRGRNREKERREEGRLTGREVFERIKAEAADEGFEEGEEDGLVEREKSDDEEGMMEATAGQLMEMKVEG